MDDTLAFAIDLARQAGQLLLEKYRSGQWEAQLKSDHSVVTSADVAADRLIVSAIQQRFPQDGLVTEELHPTGQTAGELQHFDRQMAGAGSAPVWVIDPLDGTTNFSLGIPFWGVLIARLIDGSPETAVAYFPAIDELYTARQGEGAWLNGKRLEIAPPGAKSPQSFFACCSRTHRRYQVSVPYKTRILGSAAYTLCAVARSVAILGFESVTKVWDLAAPWLVVSEAGGAITATGDHQPFPLAVGSDFASQSFSVLVAANPELIAQARHQIAPRPMV